MDLKLLTENYQNFLAETDDKWAEMLVSRRGNEMDFSLVYRDPEYKEQEKKNLDIIYQEWIKDEVKKGVDPEKAKKSWYGMQTPDGDFLESIYSAVAEAWKEKHSDGEEKHGRWY